MKLLRQQQSLFIAVKVIKFMWFVILFSAFSFQAYGQKSYHITIENDANKEVVTKKFRDSTAAAFYKKSILNEYIEKGHLEASVDKLIKQNDSTSMVRMHVGPVYSWASLKWSVEDPIFQKPSSWNKKFEQKKISVKLLQKEKKKLLKQATNRGYPFASIFFKKINIDSTYFTSELCADKGPFIMMDDITVEGEKIVSNQKIWNYVLDMKTGNPFIVDKITQIDDRINELPFVSTSQPSEVIFKDDRAAVKLYLKKKKSNHFDVIFGLQPVAASDPTRSRTILTGQITADMYNMLSGGERIFFDYRRFDKEDQNVQLALTWPFVLGTRIGADGQFSLQKRDTLNLDIQYSMGGRVPLKNRSSLKLFVQENISNILSINKAQIQNTGKLPSVLDVRRSSFGLEANITTLNFLINPTEGWDFRIRTLAGLRSIRKNQKIISLSSPGADFTAQYDSISKKTGQFRLDIQLDRFTQIFNRQVLKTSFQSGSIFSSAQPLRNELYRIGGYRLLRGFDEQSLEVNKYATGTIEYRYLLGPLSYLFIFSDFALVQTKYGNTDITDNPISFGAGLTLETKAGLFGMAAAVGQRKGLPFDFKTPKIHFGYISVF